MFIAVVGTRYSGKSTLEQYLVSAHGFISVHLIPDGSTESSLGVTNLSCVRNSLIDCVKALDSPPEGNPTSSIHPSDIPVSEPIPSTNGPSSTSGPNQTTFHSAKELLQHVTNNWRQN